MPPEGPVPPADQRLKTVFSIVRAVVEVVASPAECPTLVAPHGVSRWATADAGARVSVAGAGGLLDRYELAVGTAAVIRPGALSWLRCGPVENLDG